MTARRLELRFRRRQFSLQRRALLHPVATVYFPRTDFDPIRDSCWMRVRFSSWVWNSGGNSAEVAL